VSKLFNVIVLLLALNFLAVAGGVGWLAKSGRLGKAQVAEIKAILFRPPPEVVAETQPGAPDPSTRPSLKLDALLAEKAGLPVGQQAEHLRQMFDANSAELDRRQRELLALKDQVERAQRELDTGRGQLLKAEAAVNEREQEAARLASDQGFQDALKLYSSMPAKNVKQIFMTLDDETVVRFLRAMEPRTATKILKDFKAPDELSRAQRYLERLEKRPAATAAATPAPNGSQTKTPAPPQQAAAGGSER
jgi:flagellar motility protein MotE (MotC chaperone)